MFRNILRYKEFTRCSSLIFTSCFLIQSNQTFQSFFFLRNIRTIFVFSTRQIQWLARLVDSFHQIQLGFYETEARAIYYRERKRRNPREVDPPDANLRRHSAWLSFKPLNGRKTFLPYCIKAVINSLAIVMHLNEAETWPATFFTSSPPSLIAGSHFSNGYANRVNRLKFCRRIQRIARWIGSNGEF